MPTRTIVRAGAVVSAGGTSSIAPATATAAGPGPGPGPGLGASHPSLGRAAAVVGGRQLSPFTLSGPQPMHVAAGGGIAGPGPNPAGIGIASCTSAAAAPPKVSRPPPPPIDPSQFDDADDDQFDYADDNEDVPSPAKPAPKAAVPAVSTAPVLTKAEVPAVSTAPVLAKKAADANSTTRKSTSSSSPSTKAKTKADAPSSPSLSAASKGSKGKEQQKRISNKADRGSSSGPCAQPTDCHNAHLDDKFRLKIVESVARVKEQDASEGIRNKGRSLVYCPPTLLKAAMAVSTPLEDTKILKQRTESVCNVTNVTELGPHDVLFGRGGRTNHHQGNINFRKLLAQYKMKYIDASKTNKPDVSREVVKIWRNLEPPGRFLAVSNKHNARKICQDKKTGKMDQGEEVWHDVGNKKAQEKTSQCLRERTAQIRAAEGITALFKFGQKEEQRKAIESKKDATYGPMAADANPSNLMAAGATTNTAAIRAAALGLPSLKRQLSIGEQVHSCVTQPSPSKKLRIDDVAMPAGTNILRMVPAAPIWSQGFVQQHQAAIAAAWKQLRLPNASPPVALPSSLGMSALSVQQQLELTNAAKMQAAAEIERILRLQERIKSATERIDAAQSRIASQESGRVIAAAGTYAAASRYPQAGSVGPSMAAAASPSAFAHAQNNLARLAGKQHLQKPPRNPM